MNNYLLLFSIAQFGSFSRPCSFLFIFLLVSGRLTKEVLQRHLRLDLSTFLQSVKNRGNPLNIKGFFFNEKFPEFLGLAFRDFELGIARANVGMKKKLSCFFVVKINRNHIPWFLVVFLSLLILLLEIVYDSLQGFVFLDELKGGSGSNARNGRKIVTAAENTKVNKLLHGKVQLS